MVYILLGEGFEEMEALCPADILCRGGVDVRLVGVGGGMIAGRCGIAVKADLTAEEVCLDGVEMILLPGSGGVPVIRENAAAMALIRGAADKDLYLAAICLAPTLLGGLGLLDGRRAVCYPGTEGGLGSAAYIPDAPVVLDGKLLTSMGPGTSMEFGLAALSLLRGAETAEQIRRELCFQSPMPVL